MIHFHLAQQGARGNIVIQRSYHRMIKDNIEFALCRVRIYSCMALRIGNTSLSKAVRHQG